MGIKWQWPIKVISEDRKSLNQPGTSLTEYYEAVDTRRAAGEKVSDETILNLSHLYCGIGVRCNVLNVPIDVIFEENGSKRKVTPDDRYEWQIKWLLSHSPNRKVTPSVFFQLLETSRIIYGNGYAYIHRNAAGIPTALEWVHPDNVSIREGIVDLFYDIKRDGSEWKSRVTSLDVIHVKSLSLNGVMGKSLIEVAKDSLGFGLATQSYGNNFFEKGGRNDSVVSHPGVLKNAQKLKDSLDSQRRRGGVLVLEEGMKYDQISFSPEQAQFLESRRFSVSDGARWLNLPEFMLANNDPTYSNVENFSLHFITHNVRPTVRMYEQELNWKLLGNQPGVFVKFNLTALMRADAKGRAELYASAIQNGWMASDEVRELENLNRRGGLQSEILTPLSLATEKEREIYYSKGETNGQGTQGV